MATEMRTIYDKTVMDPARLVFSGCPKVGKGLQVKPPIVELCAGPALDLSAVPDLTKSEQSAIETILGQVKGRKANIVLDREPGPSGKPIVVRAYTVVADLTLDLVLETEIGMKTVADLYTSKSGKLRCQTPFRESSSMAAYYNVHGDGIPFVYDSGTGEKHVLDAAHQPSMIETLQAWLMAELAPSARCNDGHVFSDTRKTRVTYRDVTGDVAILRQLAVARDAPRERNGHVKTPALPTQFKSLLPFAWGTMVKTLPLETEEEAEIRPAAQAEFKKQIFDLLNHPMQDSRSGVKKPIATLVHHDATLNKGEWVRYSGLQVWGRILDDSFQIALRPGLALQVQSPDHKSIAAMTPEAFGQRCRLCGIAASGEDNRFTLKDGRVRVVILTAEFVDTLDLSTDHANPTAQAFSRAVAAAGVEPPGSAWRRKQGH